MRKKENLQFLDQSLGNEKDIGDFLPSEKKKSDEKENNQKIEIIEKNKDGEKKQFSGLKKGFFQNNKTPEQKKEQPIEIKADPAISKSFFFFL